MSETHVSLRELLHEPTRIRDYPFTYSDKYSLEPKPKKKTNYDKLRAEYQTILPKGKDDGKGFQKLVSGLIDEVMVDGPVRHIPVVKHNKIDFKHLSSKFRQLSFVEQVQDIQMLNIPSLSQVARQDILKPKLVTEDKAFFSDIASRLMRSDSTLVHLYLSNKQINDTVIKHLSLALQKNKVLQLMNLHNNSVSDEGLEMICMALR